jgi:hypothetical protein
MWAHRGSAQRPNKTCEVSGQACLVHLHVACINILYTRKLQFPVLLSFLSARIEAQEQDADPAGVA